MIQPSPIWVVRACRLFMCSIKFPQHAWFDDLPLHKTVSGLPILECTTCSTVSQTGRVSPSFLASAAIQINKIRDAGVKGTCSNPTLHSLSHIPQAWRWSESDNDLDQKLSEEIIRPVGCDSRFGKTWTQVLDLANLDCCELVFGTTWSTCCGWLVPSVKLTPSDLSSGLLFILRSQTRKYSSDRGTRNRCLSRHNAK